MEILALPMSSVSFTEQSWQNFVVLGEVNGVFAVYLTHRNVKAAGMCRVQF